MRNDFQTQHGEIILGRGVTCIVVPTHSTPEWIDVYVGRVVEQPYHCGGPDGDEVELSQVRIIPGGFEFIAQVKATVATVEWVWW